MEPISVISLDPYVLGFVKNNLVTITVGMGFLKGLALLTPTTVDDKIITLIQNAFSSLRRGGKGKEGG